MCDDWLKEMCEDWRLDHDPHTTSMQGAINRKMHDLHQQLAESQARCARMAVEIVRLRLDDYTPSNEIEAGGDDET